MGDSKRLAHSRFACLLRLGRTSEQSKKLLGLTNKMVEAFSGLPDSDPQLTIEISESPIVKHGKYQAYVHSDKNKVILVNSQRFYFVNELDGEITVIKGEV